MKKKEKGFIKNSIVAVILSVSMAFGTAFTLAGCTKTPDTPDHEQTTIVDDDNSNKPSGDTKPGDNQGEKTEKVSAISIYDDAFTGVNLKQNYVDSIAKAVEHKYPVVSLDNIYVTDTEFDEKGKIVFSFDRYNGVTQKYEPETLTFNGDTRKMETFYNMSKYKDATVTSVFNVNGVKAEDMIEKGSEVYTNLVNDFATLRQEYDNGKTAFSNMQFDKTVDPVKPDPEPEKEYVGVSSIVDKVFADVDVDKDLHELAQYISNVHAPTSGRKIEKLFAVDIDKTNSKINFIVENYTSKTNSRGLSTFSIAFQNNEIQDFLSLIQNKNDVISLILSANGVEKGSQVEKDSSDAKKIEEDLNALKQKYNAQKSIMFSKTKDDVSRTGLFGVVDLSDNERYKELNIEMNDFAKALSTNTKGTGYENVTGWTYEDVISTYSSGEGTWEGSTTGLGEFHIAVVTKYGIKRYAVGTKCYNSINRFKALIDDTAYVTDITENELYSFDNAIVYENGKRIENQKTAENTLSK